MTLLIQEGVRVSALKVISTGLELETHGFCLKITFYNMKIITVLNVTRSRSNEIPWSMYPEQCLANISFSNRAVLGGEITN